MSDINWNVVTIVTMNQQVCSQLLLPQQLIREYSELLDRPDISVFVKEALYKKIVTKCKKTNSCPHCRSITG